MKLDIRLESTILLHLVGHCQFFWGVDKSLIFSVLALEQEEDGKGRTEETALQNDSFCHSGRRMAG
jgi:hypothetical protein